MLQLTFGLQGVFDPHPWWPAAAPARFAGAPEPAPRTAVATDGTSLTAWERADGALVAAAGGRHGRFAAPLVVARRASFDFAVAVESHQRAAIAYEAADGLHVAVRSGAASTTT